MTMAPRRPDDGPGETPHPDGPPEGEAGIPPDAERDLTAVRAEDRESESFRDHLEKARRLVALELDLAETRRRLAEDNLKITEAQLELAEREIEDLKVENERLRREVEGLRGS